jgi:hypothetical protein
VAVRPPLTAQTVSDVRCRSAVLTLRGPVRGGDVTVDDGDVIDVFARVARSLAAMDDVQNTLQQIVDIAADVMPGADHAAVSLVMRRREVQTPASTDEVCNKIDQAQYDTGQGPCLDAIWEQEVVKIDDLAQGDRWPEFAKTPVSLGIRSMLSFRLFTDEDTLAR